MSLYYIPKRWESGEIMQRLIACKREPDSLRKVYDAFIAKNCWDLNFMLLEYMQYIIDDAFSQAGLRYTFGPFMRGDDPEYTPLLKGCYAFIVKRDGFLRAKTAIIELEIDDCIIDNIKKTYELYSFFAEPYVITPKNVGTVLKHFLPQRDVDFVADNVKAFRVEFAYWVACMELHQMMSQPPVNISTREPMTDEAFERGRIAQRAYAEELKAYLSVVHNNLP